MVSTGATGKIILTLLLTSATVSGQHIGAGNGIERLLDSIAVTQMQSFEIPGLAIGFIQKN